MHFIPFTSLGGSRDRKTITSFPIFKSSLWYGDAIGPREFRDSEILNTCHCIPYCAQYFQINSPVYFLGRQVLSSLLHFWGEYEIDSDYICRNLQNTDLKIRKRPVHCPCSMLDSGYFSQIRESSSLIAIALISFPRS